MHWLAQVCGWLANSFSFIKVQIPTLNDLACANCKERDIYLEKMCISRPDSTRLLVLLLVEYIPIYIYMYKSDGRSWENPTNTHGKAFNNAKSSPTLPLSVPLEVPLSLYNSQCFLCIDKLDHIFPSVPG